MLTSRRSFAAGLALAMLWTFPLAAQNKPVVIGYQLPVTGEHSQYGAVFRNSATMALEAFNKSGKLPVPVEIRYEDSKSDAKEGVNIAKKFVDDKDIVGVMGDFTSTVSMAAAQVYKDAGMPQLSQTASHPDYVKISKWQFRNITTQAQEGPFNAAWAIANGKKKFAVVSIQNDWGRSVAENFEAAVKANGGEVVETEYFNPGVRDFRSILTKVNRTRPDAIYVGMFYEEGAIFMQQRRQLNVQTPVYATSAAYSQKLIELGGESVDGLFLATTFMVTSPEPNVKAFVDEYQRRYQSEPNQFAAQAFDATNIMLAAIVRAWPNLTRESLRDSLAHTKDFPGVTGVTTFDPETREPSKTLARMEVRDGKFMLLTK